VASNTLREQVNAALDVAELRQQEAEMNAALAAAIPKGMPRGGLEVALDTHDEPFYGKTPELLTYTCKTRAKAGTTHFFRIASAYVIWRQVRLTLALTYVLPEDDLPSVVERLLQRLEHLGLHATVLYLDKGFCSGQYRYLQHIQQAAVLACPIRRKTGGIRALCQGSGSYLTDYTFTDGTSARLTLVDTRVRDPKTKHKQRNWLAFVLVNLDWTPQQVYPKYRRRFGIEASYRLLRQVKVLTNSRNPALCFFFLGLGLLMQNVWVLAR
jgi:putative transposase